MLSADVLSPSPQAGQGQQGPTVLKMQVHDGGIRIDYRLVAVALVALWALDYKVVGALTTGVVAGSGSLPLWWPALKQYRFGRPILAFGTIALACGVLWAVYFSSTRPYTVSGALAQIMVVLTLLGGIGLLLWARTKLPLGVIAMTIGVAMLAARATEISSSSNIWKFEIGTAVTLIVLGAVVSRAWWLQGAVLVLLIGVGIAFDSRSFAMICFLGGGLLLLQRLGVRPKEGWRGTLVLGLVAVLVGIVLSTLATTLVLKGAFGEQLADRTEAQVERAGSVLSGGRPEWSGTIGLMANRPIGFGFGAVPTYEDVWSAREGLAAVGIGTSSTYPDNYMFRGAFKLHSVTADLWSQTGIAGLIFAGVLIVAALSSISERLRLAEMSALTGVLAVKALWDIGFSPMQSTGMIVAVAIGLVLVLKDPAGAEADDAQQVQDPVVGEPRQFMIPV